MGLLDRHGNAGILCVKVKGSATMKDGDLFQIGLEACGVLTCQDEVSTSSVCTAVTRKTKHKTENTVNNTEFSLVLVLQHQVQAHG